MGYALCFPVAVLFFFFFLLFVDVPIPSQPFSIFFSFLPSPLHVTHDDRPQVCDYSYGHWVWDEGYGSKYYGEDCPFLDPGFQCRANGRKDTAYLNWRWQPYGCDLPRFNATDMLERSRNGKIIFAGDSIGRNQWESLVCMLAKGVGNPSRIFEEYGSPITKHWGFLSIVFQDYNLTVEYYRSPYLVVMGRPPADSPSQVKRTIRLDVLAWQSKRWADADVLILNAGHWWNEDKTTKSGSYFQVGQALNMTMDVKEAFGRTLRTVREWALRNLKQENSYFFFRSYAPSHYSNGTWDNAGSCHTDSAPETKASALELEPWNNEVISDMIEEMKGDGRKLVQLLNITYSTGFRKDGHPSSHREPGTPADAPQDCSHWCLPGVPDMWNELLYAHLLSMDYDTKRKI
ncbi:protein trichome birefringence-like 8 [Elaeis guineensis]|uniref:Protein trichome birefringence-like 8 n=1 Tax=Elaeis guineensis var. tenera TaxID=51953 RepID=A0A6J0PML2_ELAGV|nr:protein trichome birefringence-like 8 [Elaeis guineensis]